MKKVVGFRLDGMIGTVWDSSRMFPVVGFVGEGVLHEIGLHLMDLDGVVPAGDWVWLRFPGGPPSFDLGDFVPQKVLADLGGLRHIGSNAKLLVTSPSSTHRDTSEVSS